jgi:RNA polymerase sigma factor (sigma-70 family)
MMKTMASEESDSIHTRPSLLNRLRQKDDTESWQEFYRIYGKLVRDFALQAGLTDIEADEVVQETAIALARNLPEFRYDPKVCRFKTWLLNQASWRTKDQLRKRNRGAGVVTHHSGDPGGYAPLAVQEETARTSTINRVPDPAAPNLDALFETEWRESLFAEALERVKRKFGSKQFQVFDLLVRKEWPAKDVARSLGISLANVYFTRHRFEAAVAKEIRQLEREMERLAGDKARRFAAEAGLPGCHAQPRSTSRETA